MNVGKFLSSLMGKFWCLIGSHDWTSKAEQGILPDKKLLKANPIDYFWDYSAMYCNRPGCKAKYKGR